jgi:hypothetical protein
MHGITRFAKQNRLFDKCDVAPPLTQRRIALFWDPQGLARIDLVGMGQHGAICLKNLGVAAGLTQGFLRDGRQSIALFYNMKLWLWALGGGLYGGDTLRISSCDNDFFFHFSGYGITRDHNFVAVHRDLDTFGIQTNFFPFRFSTYPPWAQWPHRPCCQTKTNPFL